MLHIRRHRSGQRSGDGAASRLDVPQACQKEPPQLYDPLQERLAVRERHLTGSDMRVPEAPHMQATHGFDDTMYAERWLCACYC